MATHSHDGGAVEVARASAAPRRGGCSQPERRPAYRSVNEVPNEVLADTVALILEQFCAGGAYGVSPVQRTLPDPTDPAALFFSPAKQTAFTLSFYCRRLVEYTCCSKSCFVVAILYLARLAEACPVFLVNEFNVHRLVCTAVVLAAKWLDDVTYSNEHYAKVAGVQTSGEMTCMENHMLHCLDYRLYVQRDDYFDVEASLLKIASSWL